MPFFREFFSYHADRPPVAAAAHREGDRIFFAARVLQDGNVLVNARRRAVTPDGPAEDQQIVAFQVGLAGLECGLSPKEGIDTLAHIGDVFLRFYTRDVCPELVFQLIGHLECATGVRINCNQSLHG